MGKVVDPFTLASGVPARIQAIRSVIESGLATLQSPARIQAAIQPELERLKTDVESICVEMSLLSEMSRLMAVLNQLHGCVDGSIDPQTLASIHDAVETSVQSSLAGGLGTPRIIAGPAAGGMEGRRPNAPST